MFAQLLVTLAVLASASAKLYPADPTHQKYMWEAFKTEFKREYSTMTEETHRFAVFLENLQMADLRNTHEQKAGGSATHGVTRFSDLSQAEFESQFLTADISKRSSDSVKAKIARPVDTTAGLVDWSGVLTTPVKDQGYCGSCWAFSATEQIESDYMREKGSTYILSPEQITQCATKAYGCSGGWTEVAYAYVKASAGMVQDSDYPYTSYQGVTGRCAVDYSQAVVGITGFTAVDGESAMASYVQSTGPLSVCLDAETWNSYTGGIMSTCGQNVDHCVQAVGVDASSGGYWKVRNSWGTSWGESGYIRLAYGANTCDITNDPTYVATK